MPTPSAPSQVFTFICRIYDSTHDVKRTQHSTELAVIPLVKRSHIIILSLLVIAGLGWFAGTRLFVSEERRVAKTLDTLIGEFEQTGQETILVAAGKAKKIIKHFAPEFTANPGPPFSAVTDEREFTGMISSFRMATQTLNIRTLSRDVRVVNNEASVVTRLSAHYTGRGDTGSEVREFEIRLKKIGGDWRISKVDLLNRRN